MSEYTPSTEYVRDMYVEMHLFGLTAMDEFDRWLAQHDTELRESIAADIDEYRKGALRGTRRIPNNWIDALNTAPRIVRGEV